ncbi:MAG: hypothetical protein JW818_13590 [Pirellulales bacterium]|nr:hypothetical protein [Pirellulales bacterium]
MKLRLGLLLLLVVLAAFTSGWWFGARSEGTRSAKREAEIETVAQALNAATFINLTFQATDVDSPERRSRRRNGLLISELLYLARAEPYRKENQKDTFLRHADSALNLLRTRDLDELRRAVEKASLVNSVKAPFLDENNGEYDAMTDFVRRAFDRRKSQPTYPARVWLDAIVNTDPSLLKTAYSDQLASRD